MIERLKWKSWRKLFCTRERNEIKEKNDKIHFLIVELLTPPPPSIKRIDNLALFHICILKNIAVCLIMFIFDWQKICRHVVV